MIVCQEGLWRLLEYDAHPIQEPLRRKIVEGQTRAQGMANAIRMYINKEQQSTHTYIRAGKGNFVGMI